MWSCVSLGFVYIEKLYTSHGQRLHKVPLNTQTFTIDKCILKQEI